MNKRKCKTWSKTVGSFLACVFLPQKLQFKVRVRLGKIKFQTKIWPKFLTFRLVSWSENQICCLNLKSISSSLPADTTLKIHYTPTKGKKTETKQRYTAQAQPKSRNFSTFRQTGLRNFESDIRRVYFLSCYLYQSLKFFMLSRFKSICLSIFPSGFLNTEFLRPRCIQHIN